MSNALAIVEPTGMEVANVGIRDLSPERRELLRKTVASGCENETEFELFMEVCRHTGLDPFAKQIYAISRGRGDRRQMSIQTGIDGYRLVAQRSGDYAGQEGPQWCGEDGEWRDVWFGAKPPSAARVGVWRKGWQSPVWGIAVFDEYAEKYDGKLGSMWAKMPALMIAKCAEALAIRKAFPQELSGIYTAEEMAQADNEPAALATPTRAQSRPRPVAQIDPWAAAPGWVASLRDWLREEGTTIGVATAPVVGEATSLADGIARLEAWAAGLPDGADPYAEMIKAIALAQQPAVVAEPEAKPKRTLRERMGEPEPEAAVEEETLPEAFT